MTTILPPGRYTFGADTGRLLVLTGRSGLGSRAGHDLTIEAARWHGEAVVSPGGPGGSAVTVSVEAGSLEVRSGTGGVKPLTETDRAQINKTIRETILGVQRHPAIDFRSQQLSGAAQALQIVGDLTIMGVTRPVTVQVSATGDQASGRAVIAQSQWGIRPFSAFFGALRLKDEVEITFDVRLRLQA